MLTFRDLTPEKTYVLGSKQQDFQSWINLESSVMEEEAVLAVKRVEKGRLFYSVETGKTVQEWDGIIHHVSTDTLFLIQCKHAMQNFHLKDMKKKIEEFQEMLKTTTSTKDKSKEKEFKLSYKKLVGIACSGSFM
jgi:hypothetical protein